MPNYRGMIVESPSTIYAMDIYCVVGGHPDDGTPYTFSYWSCLPDAECEAMRQRKLLAGSCSGDITSRPVTVWYAKDPVTSKKIFYKPLRLEQIIVDPPTVESIKNKLTDDELDILGLKR